MEYQGRESQIKSFTITRDWVRTSQYLIVDGLGDSLIDARVSTYTESWLVNPLSRTASRTNRFGVELREASEMSLSPIGMLRPLIERAVDAREVSSDPGTNGRRVRVLEEGGFVLEMDIIDRDIVAVREGPGGGTKPFLETHFRDWIDLPSGNRIPLTIETHRFRGSESVAISTVHRITSHTELPAGTGAPPFVVPGGFTVIDHFTGVTRGPDGRVIAQISESERFAAHYDPPIPASKSAGPSLVRLAVGAVALAVAVAGFVILTRKA